MTDEVIARLLDQQVAEIERLRAQNAELLEALKKCAHVLEAQRMADLRNLGDHYKLMADRLLNEGVRSAIRRAEPPAGTQEGA